MQASLRQKVHRGITGVAVLVAAGSYIACSDDSTAPELPDVPFVVLQTNADTVTVMWSRSPDATGYRVELTGNPSSFQQTVGADVLSLYFTSADGIEDDATYTAAVTAVTIAGEFTSTNSASTQTNFFPWDENFPTSLHATGQGKLTWYNDSPNHGFQEYTGVNYNDLSCKGCHEPSITGGCTACHDSETPQLGAEVDASLTGECGSCHGRQKAEALVHGYSDVHRDAGMDCMSCHTLGDVHGDGNAYASMLDPGAIDASCDQCHEDLVDNSYHTQHANDVDCSACHVQSVVSCYNCHFETEIELGVKKAYGQFKDWVFLVNYEDKVHAANFQSVKYEDKTFVAMAPFYAHTIAREARTCGDCHGSPAVEAWQTDGAIDVVTWDADLGALTHRTGIIPVPPNYETGLGFDFVDLDAPGGAVWSFMKSGADRIQLLYGTPLTQEQMDKLK